MRFTPSFKVMCHRNFKYISTHIISKRCSYSNKAYDFHTVDLNCNRLFKVDEKHPFAFSWKIQSKQNNWSQDASRILVSDSKETLNNHDGNCSYAAWKWRSYPVVANTISVGEVYDANLETQNWSKLYSEASPDKFYGNQ